MVDQMLLLSKDTAIAKIINGKIEPILPNRMPLFLQRTGDINYGYLLVQ